MNRDRIHFLLLNIGHFMDHLFTLVFATVAALALTREWGLPYAALLSYATPGFLAFGLFSLPAGWLADKWNREGMMVVFFTGIGTASIATGLAATPLQVGIGLFVIGMFAAIYHPVGLAIVTARWKNTGMRIAVNGVFGNLGVASAALLTGFLIDHGGWRSAFVVPGVVSIGLGAAYAALRWPEVSAPRATTAASQATSAAPLSPDYRALMRRLSVIVFATTALTGVVFQATTFSLPKIFDERLRGIAESLAGSTERGHVAGMIGMFAFAVFTIASMAQLVVGKMLDRYGPRPVFMTLAVVQIVFFAAMPGLTNYWALAIALGFMLGAFGQIPINDYMIGRMASGAFRARVYGVRYVVSFTVLAAALPLVAVVYGNWGFDTLFRMLAIVAGGTLAVTACLPRRLPVAA